MLNNPYKSGENLSIEEIETGKYDSLDWIDKIVEETGVTYSLFKLTHAQKYYSRILEYANKGCYIYYTALVYLQNKLPQNDILQIANIISTHSDKEENGLLNECLYFGKEQIC